MKLTAATIGACLCVAALAAQNQGDAARTVLSFSDPSKPGTVRVSVMQGTIRVSTTSGRDVIVTTDEGSGTVVRRDGDQRGRTRPEAAGLRRLTQGGGLRADEDNNVISIGPGRVGGRQNISVQVPARTNLALRTIDGGNIEVDGVSGDIEVNSVSGGIRLTDVSGAVVAQTVNGGVRVVMKQVTADKPMSFTSFNGDVDVTLPGSTKANLKLRSDNGDVYTDFDVQQLRSTRGAGQPAPPTPPRAPMPFPDGGFGPQGPRPRPFNPGGRNRLDEGGLAGAINGGGADVELRTFNGDVFLRKGQ